MTNTQAATTSRRLTINTVLNMGNQVLTALINFAQRFGSMTRPEDLGALTESMLQAEAGKIEREVTKMARWLAEGHQQLG